jgi:hypothetical protein
MINYKQLCSCILIIFFSSQPVFTQIDSSHHNHKIGFTVGYGSQVVNLLGIKIDLKVPYFYDVYLFEFDYYLPLYSNKTWSIETQLRFVYGITSYKKKNNSLSISKNNEVGVSSGFLIGKSFFENFLKIYFVSSIGPYFSFDTPDRQISGFLFCGNYDVGINLELRKNVYIDLRTGFRHISNAGLRNPNGGLNNWMINGGLVIEM